MVKQRFLTHFKPWLFAVSKAGALIVAYQLLDQARRRFQFAAFDISDVLKAATIALVTLAVFCGLWAWTEWCWFKLRGLRLVCRGIKRTFADYRNSHKQRSAPLTGRMA